MAADAAYYRDLLRQRFAGSKVVLAVGSVAPCAKLALLMRELGAERPLLLAEGMGQGDPPPAEDLEWVVVGSARSPTILDNLRGYERGLAKLPDEAAAMVERYDPDKRAVVVRAMFIGLQQIAGRRVWAAKDPRWIAFEDKVTIDEFWDRIGAPRAPCEIVRAEHASLQAAATRLDRGAGTVWAGDARDGWHGGAELTRWVRDGDHSVVVAAELSAVCDRVRVMPFLEGIPCSIHGMVFPDYVLAGRPVELVVLRSPGSSRFRYSTCSTLWDPPDADRESMRALARRTGEALRDEIGFRGSFTIDGVMTADGFRPTEINPRYGAGLGALSRSIPELPLYLIDQAVTHGEPWDFRPRELEALLIQAADTHRVGGFGAWDTSDRSVSETVALQRDADGSLRRACDGEAPLVTIDIGPSFAGTFLRATLDSDQARVGAPVAPLAVEVLAWCDRELGTQLGALEASVSVR